MIKQPSYPLTRRHVLGAPLAACAVPLPGLAAGSDADLIAAAEALDRMLESHEALYDRLDAAGLDPWSQPAFTASLHAMRAAGTRYARTPAGTIRGLLLKLRRLRDDTDGGVSHWHEDLMRGIVADAERFEAVMGVEA
ncbi:hypothetical protein [Azospirillum sp.]|uniref:hypothetical protein n=1 Tax=Azospirillum sp. TaxID=34012 RepID=UPI002D5F4A71|nr:hypothetical protein [Azospirillum sp.]HYD64281.1 hypothetical protein [Azospirillum sp.]